MTTLAPSLLFGRSWVIGFQSCGGYYWSEVGVYSGRIDYPFAAHVKPDVASEPKEVHVLV